MSNKTLRTVLICVICILITVLCALGSLLIIRTSQTPSGTVTPTAATTQETAGATTQATTEATQATTVETTVETEPQPERYVLTFVGDCTMGNQKGASLTSGFIGTVGQNYDYPFANVMEYFANDTATFINLEGTFTDSTSSADKMFVFKGPKDYINILTQGSVEFANVANNHSEDYGKQGYDDTVGLLKEHGIAYGEHRKTTLFEVDGLKIGVYSVAGAYNTNGVAENIKALKKAGAEVIIACMHWGEEYYYVPNQDRSPSPGPPLMPAPTSFTATIPIFCRRSSSIRTVSSSTAWVTSPSAATAIPRTRIPPSCSRSLSVIPMAPWKWAS